MGAGRFVMVVQFGKDVWYNDSRVHIKILRKKEPKPKFRFLKRSWRDSNPRAPEG